MFSCLAIAASLVLVGVFAQVLDGARHAVSSLKDRVEVEIYLKEGVSRRAAMALVADVAAIDGVADVIYVDKAAAADEFRSMFGKDLLSALTTNPLPASLRVRFERDASVRASSDAVSTLTLGNRSVDQVESGQSWLGEVERLAHLGAWVGVVLLTVLCLSCGFAVSNTAKLMVLAQREAIEIMRVVGASNGFIRMTFLMGGGLQGAIGGVLAGAAILLGSPLWAGAIPAESTLSSSLVVVGLIGLGTLLGIVGSWASLNRVLQAVG